MATLFMLCSCGLFAPRSIVLWTNKIEVLFEVERYNAEQARHRIEFQYFKDIDRALDEGATQPDLVIATGLANSYRAQFLLPLDSLLRTPLTDYDFYAQLLELGEFDRQQRLVPLSFNLPVIIFLRDSNDNGWQNEEAGSPARRQNEVTMALENIRDIGAEFNRQSDNRFSHMGYSPRWDSEFLSIGMRALSVEFVEDDDGNIDWNRTMMNRAINFFAGWIEETNGGIEQELDFTQRYLYAALPQLITDERIRFAYTRSDRYMQLATDVRERLDYRWLESPRGVPVIDDIVYAGITSEGSNRRGATNFLDWLLMPANQRHSMLSQRDKGGEGFGFIGGFSVLHSVNRRYLPELYPELLGRIMPPESLLFPPQAPRHWDEIRTEVVEPWIIETLAGDNLDSLSKSISEWQLRSAQ